MEGNKNALSNLDEIPSASELSNLDEIPDASPKQTKSPQGAESGLQSFVSTPYTAPKTILPQPTSPSTSESGSTSSVGGKSKVYEPTIQDINAKITDVTLRQKFPEYGKQKSFTEASKDIALQKTEQQAEETEQRRKQRRLELIPQQIKKINEDKVALLKENTFEAKQKLGAMAAVEKKLSTELDQENKVKYPELQNMPKKVVAGMEDEIHEYLNSDPYIKSKIEKVGATDEIMNELLMKATQKKTAPLIQDINLFKEEGTVDIAKQKTDIAKQIGAAQSELQQLATQINEIQDKELNQKGYKDLSLQLTKQQSKVNALSPQINKLNDEYKSFSPELLQIENKLKEFEPKIKNNTFTGSNEEYRLYQQLQSDYNDLLSKRNEIVSNPSNVAYAKEIENLNTLVNQKNDLVKGLQNTTYNAAVAKYELAKGKYNELNNKYSELDTPEINERLGKYYQTANKLSDLTSKYESARGNIASISEIENAQAKVNKEQGIGADIGARSVNSILSAASSLVAYPFREAASWHGEDGKYHYSDMIADWIDSGNKPFLTNKNNDFVNAETGELNWGVAPIVGSLADNLGIIVTLALTGKFATPIVAEGIASTAPTLMEAEKATELAKVYTTVIPAYMSSFHQSMQEAKEMGFTGAGAQVFGRTMAMLEGVSELISPDQELVFGKGVKNGMLKEFIENYAKSGKEATKKLVTDFVNNVGGEVSEEYAIMLGKTLGSTIGHAVDSDISVYLPTINEVTSTAVTSGALGGVMGSFGQYAESKQLNSIGKLQFAKNFEQGKDILDGLKEKGAITQEKYDKVINETQKYQSVLGQIPEGISDYKKVAIIEKLLEIKSIKEGMPKEQSDIFEKIANKKIAEIQKGIEAIIDDADFDKNAEIEVKKEIEKQNKVSEPIKFTSPTNDLYGYVEENGVKRNLTKAEFENYGNRVVEQQVEAASTENGGGVDVIAEEKVQGGEEGVQEVADVFYHGTPNGFIEKFDKSKIGSNKDEGFSGDYGKGFYFGTSEEGAKTYASGKNANVVSVKLDIQNPLDLRKLSKYNEGLTKLAKETQGGIFNVTDEQRNELAKSLDTNISEIDFMSDLLDKMNDNYEDNGFEKEITNKGYDALIAPNGERVVYDPNKIKIIKQSVKSTPTPKSQVNEAENLTNEPQIQPIVAENEQGANKEESPASDVESTGKLQKGEKVIYHHTQEDISDIKSRQEGTWFTTNEYSPMGARAKGKNILSKVINDSKLKLATDKEYFPLLKLSEKERAKKLIEQGFDGVKRKVDGDVHYLIFDLEKLSSTTKSESLLSKEQTPKEVINKDNNEANNIQPNSNAPKQPQSIEDVEQREREIADREAAISAEEKRIKAENELAFANKTMPVDNIVVAPDVMQFKAADEESGVNKREKLKGKFDKEVAGAVDVWIDKENELGYGKNAHILVDGHHRMEFAKRNGETDMNVFYIDAPTAKDARVIGAKANIAQGRGTSIDAAKIYREATPEQLDGFKPTSKVAKEGKELANLEDSVFNLVTQGKLDIPTAIAISKVPKELQEAFYKKVKKNEASGAIKMTPKGLLEMADMIVGGNAAAKEVAQMDIFGNTAEQELLVFEQAQLQSDIKEELAKDAKILGSANRNKEVLEKANNILNLEENAKLAQSSKLASGLFDTYKNRKNIAEIIKKATLDLSNTKSRKQRAEIKEKATSEVKKAIEAELENDFNGGKGKEVVVQESRTEKKNEQPSLDTKIKNVEDKRKEAWKALQKKIGGSLGANGKLEAIPELFNYIKLVSEEYILKAIKAGVEFSERDFIKYFKSEHDGLDVSDRDISNAYVNQRQSMSETKETAFRKSALSEVQNTFKNAPKAFETLVTEGLSKLKPYKGESVFGATERLAINLLDRISRKENVVLNTAETAQLQFYHTSLRKQAFDIANSDMNFAEKQAKLAELKIKTDDAEKIWGAVGQEQARAFAMRQLEMSMTPKQKLEMRRMEFYSESGVDPKELSQKQIDETDAKIKTIHENYEAKQKELAKEYEAKLKEQAEKHLAEIEKGKKVGGITVEKPRQSFVERASKKLKDNPKLREIFNNKDRSQDIIEKVDKGRKEGKSIDEIVDELVNDKDISEANAPKVKKFFREQEIEMAKEAGKIDNDMLREAVEKLVENGANVEKVSIEDIIGQLKEDYFSDLTDRQVRDMITNYGKTRKLNYDPIATTIGYAKQVGTLLSKIADLKEGKRPTKAISETKEQSEQAKIDREAKISQYKKQLNELLKNIPIDEATKANQLKTAQDRIKTHLVNSIKELEEQIASGKKKGARKTVEYNQENKDLRQKRDELRTELNNLVGKTEIPLEERIRRAVKGIEKSERNYERRIAEREFTTEKKQPLTSPEIEIAKAKRDLRKAEFEKLKQESLPVIDERAELFGNISELAEKESATTFTNEMVKQGYVDKLVKQKIEEGLRGEEVIKQIKEDLKSILPDLTESDIQKAILKIDEFKQQTKQQVLDANKKAQQEVSKLAKIKNEINDIIEFGKLTKGKVFSRTEVSQAIRDEQLRKKAWGFELDEIKKANKDLKNKESKILELNKKIASANGRQQMWEKIQKNPKVVDELLAEKRKQLRETLNANGLSPENENITNRKKLIEIGKNLSDAISKFKSELADNKDLKDIADALSLSNYKRSEKKSDLLRKDKQLVEDMALSLSEKRFKAESSKLYEILYDIEKQENLAKEQKASENFIKNTERSIGKNTRELVQGKFEETNIPAPLLNAQSIKMKAAKDASDRAFRLEQEKFQRANMNKVKKFLTDYVGWVRSGLVSGLNPLPKIGLSSLVRPVAETFSRFAFNKLISRVIMPNLSKVQRNEGFYSRATKAAHALGNAFKTEADVKALRDSLEKDFNDAKIAYDKDPSDINKERLNIATREFAYGSVFDFIQANSWGEFTDMIAGRQTRLQEVFGIDKGKMWDEVKGKYETAQFMFDTFGRLHGAIKNFSGRAEFMRAFMTNIQNDMLRGEDPMTIDNTMIYALSALKASKEGTYQKDIITTTEINSFIQRLQANKKKGVSNDGLFAEGMALITRYNYPIMKTPLNIWKEFAFDYVLGIPLSAGKQMLNWGGEWRQVAKEMQTNSFKEKWAKVNERLGQTEDSDFVDELKAGYRRGMTGALVMGLVGIGAAVLNDDDEWTIFGIKFAKEESKAISHLSVMMPAEVIEKFKEGHEKAIENGSENPNLDGVKEAFNFIKKQNVFFNDYQPSASAGYAALVPNIRAYGDYRKMTEGQRKPTTPLDYLKTTSGIMAGDVPLKDSKEAKYKITADELNSPSVKAFKASVNYDAIDKAFKEEAVYQYAKKVKEIEKSNLLSPSNKNIELLSAMADVQKSIAEKQGEAMKDEFMINELNQPIFNNKPKTNKEKADVFITYLINYKFSTKKEKLDKWQKAGILNDEIRKIIEQNLKNN